MPNSDPEPKSSRITPTHIKRRLYPKPFPTPSIKESNGLFFIAKASARPMTMQFVIIKPTKTDNVFDISYAKALII